ncbi:unnamed protein product, partial [Didymodactylos carnosus]
LLTKTPLNKTIEIILDELDLLPSSQQCHPNDGQSEWCHSINSVGGAVRLNSKLDMCARAKRQGDPPIRVYRAREPRSNSLAPT